MILLLWTDYIEQKRNRGNGNTTTMNEEKMEGNPGKNRVWGTKILLASTIVTKGVAVPSQLRNWKHTQIPYNDAVELAKGIKMPKTDVEKGLPMPLVTSKL